MHGYIQVLKVLLTLACNKVASLLIGAAGMGLADLYQHTCLLMGNATNLGLCKRTISCLSKTYSQKQYNKQYIARYVKLIRTWAIMTAIWGTLLTAVLSPLLSYFTTSGLSHTYAYLWLSPMVGFTTLISAETTILKATNQLKRVVYISVLSIGVTLILSLILYDWLGIKGIVPLLVLTACYTFILHLKQTTSEFPYRIGQFHFRFFRKGFQMLKLSRTYLLVGILVSGAEVLIRVSMTRSPEGVVAVGYYAAGIALTAGYARIALGALSTNYLPQLTTVGKNTQERNRTINHQINKHIALITPFLLLICLCLPKIIYLLYTGDFMKIMPMVLPAALFIYFKAIYTPVTFVPIICGDHWLFLWMKVVIHFFFCLCVILGYTKAGLMGAGLGLALSHLIALLCITTIYAFRYQYRMDYSTLRSVFLFFILLCIGLMIATQRSVPFRAIGGTIVLALMLPNIYKILKKAVQQQ